MCKGAGKHESDFFKSMPLLISFRQCLRAKGFGILFADCEILLPSLLPFCLFLCGCEFELENNYIYPVVDRKPYVKQKLHKNLLKPCLP